MDNSIGAQIQAADVKFFPPLHEQRRSWALDILRRERVTSVLDVGCGEGVLLQHLTHAPPWRAHTPSTPAPAVFEKPEFIHIRELHGLDILKSDLLYAADMIAPPHHSYGWTRFEQLDVSIWEGGVQAPNPAFKGIECIVATELVEHLPEDVLQTFIPTLLGNYSPRLLLLTTPCFDFNTRFRAPGNEDWGFRDPTGRTTRIFRHEDHKFEWTVDECLQWCKEAADQWGYEVTVDGVGRSITKDPWGRDDDTIRASQVAIFRRREGDEWAAKRAAKYAEWVASREVPQPSELLATHRYEAHASAEKPAVREEIVAAVKTTIQDIGSPTITTFELWREDSVSTICAGWLEVLLDVLEQDQSFVVQKEGKNADDWIVEVPGLELRSKSPWASTTKADDAWGESSETTDTTTETYDEEEEYAEYDEEYDGEYWEETEDGWAVSESEGRAGEVTDVNAMKAWEEWRPAPGWLVESTWD